MKFSRLKITGFKSFCDESELQLYDGLTAIVGPNGCGKSNLVEALRWVMGESSYKAMRASGMDDVIFSGSANRPSRNSAEVTLVLDNSDRSAPASLNIADILEVTRRIERESGSSYRVNGREVRAKDVQLLFADASTGARSPALVRQGQIGEIIAAKPVQRRALLEEAAGISGLHSRRHEAELRLRAAEQNLERVDDVVAQIEEQLANLKRQARQATRYRNISGDIRKNEALLYHIRWVNARFELKNMEAQQAKLIKNLADITHKYQLANKAHSENDKRLAPLRDDEVKKGAILQRLKILSEQLEQELTRAQNQEKELKERKNQIISDYEREKTLILEADEILKNLKEELNELQKQDNNQEQNIKEAREKFANIKQKLENTTQEGQEIANRLAQIKAQKSQAQTNMQMAQQKLANFKQQEKEISLKLENIAANSQNDEKIKQYQLKLKEQQKLTQDAQEESQKQEQISANIQEEIENLRPQLAKAQSRVSTLQSEAATLTRVLNIDDNSLWPAIIDELKVKKGYESAIGAALGDDLEAPSNDSAPIYWQKPADFENDEKLPNEAISLNQFVTAPKLLERRLRQIGLVDESLGKKLMLQLKPGQRLVSIKGDLWRWDGFVAKAGAPTSATKRMEQRNRLNELDNEIEQAKIICAEFEEKIAQLKEQRNRERSKEQEIKQKWQQAQSEINKLQNILEKEQQFLINLTAQKSAALEAKERIAQNILESEKEIEKAKEILSDNEIERELSEKNQQFETKLSQLKNEAEQAQSRLNELENQAKLRNIRLEQIEKEKNIWLRRKNEAQKQLEELNKRQEEIDSKLELLAKTPDEFTLKRERLYEEIEIAQDDYKNASDRLAQAQNLYRESEKNLREMGEAQSLAREELARIEERIKSYMAQIKQIEQITLENLAIPASQAAKIAQIKPDAPLPDEQKIEKKVERLKIERERLGGVNLGAEREMEEVSEKLEIMLNDKQDLIAAISKLRSGIASLNKEGRARLNDAFDKVNSHFKSLFTALFGGGEAELKFVESEDPLEAGLEIIARPPGKKPQIMTLLSGGEQALTALSLIFAVFLTNPAPICVLDEVDAPLDDANVERFCNLLDEMCERTDTRFILVTHNPITMSRCDRLFGVTMAERGVSQIVSVDLTFAKQVAQAG